MSAARLRAALSAALLAAAAAWPAVAAPGCAEFVARLPNLPLRLCEQAALQPGPARSVKGTPLYLRDVADEGARLRVLVVGAIHRAERSSAAEALPGIPQAQEGPRLPPPGQRCSAY